MEYRVQNLLDIMARLRNPDGGCPWDVEQTFATVAPYTIEEAYEVADAIDRDDMTGLCDELGDLLFQVVFHARMAEERGVFDFQDVVAGLCEKMVRRHPHVFGDERIETAASQTRNWEELKAEERAEKGGHEIDVPLALPSLLRAEKIGKRASRLGFDWPDATGVFAKVREELEELEDARKETRNGSDAVAEETGDLLFAAANLARHLGVNPEESLRRANAKFQRRFKIMEGNLAAEQKDIPGASLDELEQAWDVVKRSERPPE